jgi:hypothetical protein
MAKHEPPKAKSDDVVILHITFLSWRCTCTAFPGGPGQPMMNRY